jgi:hypothetical protein
MCFFGFYLIFITYFLQNRKTKKDNKDFSQIHLFLIFSFKITFIVIRSEFHNLTKNTQQGSTTTHYL